MPLTLGSLILRYAPKKLVRSLAGKTIRKLYWIGNNFTLLISNTNSWFARW
jgi:hypothetical protein